MKYYILWENRSFYSDINDFLPLKVMAHCLFGLFSLFIITLKFNLVAVSSLEDLGVFFLLILCFIFTYPIIKFPFWFLAGFRFEKKINKRGKKR